MRLIADCILAAIEQSPCVSGDHKILVCRYNPRRNARIVAGDARATRGVGAIVERNAKPLSIAAYSSPNFRGILADAAGKHDSIEAMKCCRERTEFASDPIDKEINGLLRGRKRAREQYAHVAR